jgi:beta-galactosidase
MRHDHWSAPADHLVAWDQVELRSAHRPRGGRLPKGSAVDAAIDDLLVLPVELSLWRAPTDNDGFKLLPELSERLGVGGQALRHWKAAGVHNTPAEQLVEHRSGRSVSDDGLAVVYRHHVRVPDSLADLPRVGVRFSLPGRFRNLRWYGRGPHENYPDRNASAMLGEWAGTPDVPPYLVPQEFGLRTDTRWLECADPLTGERVRVDVLQPLALHMSATNYRAQDLSCVPTKRLASRRIGGAPRHGHRGLGTASCRPDVLPQYRLPAGSFDFDYRLTVIGN